MHRTFILLFCMIGLMIPTMNAQEDDETPPTFTVPDVLGLTIPQAAAALNAAGYQLGEEIISVPEGGEAPSQSEIVAQSVEAGTEAEPGSAVDVTVIRSNNMLLIYDDNDITMVNQSGAGLDLTTVAFSSSNTRFNANRWGNTALDAADCTQLWSVGRGTPKSVNECGAIQRWLTTNNTNEHFWTRANDDTTFSVIQSGVVRAECSIATAPSEILTCDFFMATGDDSEVTEFVYMAYTPTQFLVHNIADDLWMPLQGIELVGSNGVTVPLVAESTLFDEPIVIGDVNRLAPGQCLYYTAANTTDTEPPEDCFEIGRASLPSEGPFAWQGDFEVVGITGQAPATCPAAEEGRMTLCIAPR